MRDAHQAGVHCWGQRRAACGWLLMLLSLLLALPVRTAQGAPPDNWEVLRVFIQDDPEQISRLVTSHYATVLLDDLARELAEHNNRRRVSPLKTPALAEAIYVARLEGDILVSDQTRWKLQGVDGTQPVDLGNVSLALRSARGIPTSEVQLLEQAQFSPAGAIELPAAAEGRNYWFGFTVPIQQRATERLYDLQIPPATLAKLYVSAPLTVSLFSPSLVVEKIPSLTSLLPEDWPSGSLQSAGSGSQWWLIHLSGASRCELAIRQAASTPLTDFQHVLRTATVDYEGSGNGLRVHAQFSVLGQPGGAELQLRADPRLKIETISVNGLPVPWRAIPQADAAEVGIELLEPGPATVDMDLQIRASAAGPEADTSQLPQLYVAGAYALDGICRLSGSDGWVADAMLVDGQLARRIPRTADSGGLTPLTDPLLWQTRWLGTPPKLQARFSQQQLPAIARSLTRFSVQAEWLSAQCRMRIDAPQLHSNELRLPVGKGWFIDSVRLVGGEADLRARFEDRQDAANATIVIHWEGNRKRLAVDLEVVAHSPRDTNADTISLRSPRLVSLPNADQTDNYVIEPTSRYVVQLGSKLLPYQRQIFELPVWQQELLPAATEMWAFQGVRGSIPPITLVASSGTFSSRLTTVVRAGDGTSEVTTRIHCTPISGSLDRIRLTLPADAATADWQWMLEQPEEPEERLRLSAATVVEAEVESDTGLPAEQLLELEWPTPLATPFTLVGQLHVKSVATEGGALGVPVPGIPAATAGESLVLVPRNLAAGLQQPTAELLPTTHSQLPDDWPASAQTAPDDGHSNWLAVRTEVNLSHMLRVQWPSATASAGWAWSESIQHVLSDNGHIDHHVQWLLDGTGQEPLQIALPAGWQVEQLTVNGRPATVVQTDQRVHLELAGQQPDGQQPDGQQPDGQQPGGQQPGGQQAEGERVEGLGRTAVDLHCVSRQSPPQWLSYHRLARPELSLPVLMTRATLAVPPTRLAVQRLPYHWLPSDASLRLLDRLLPTRLWSLLAPTAAAGDSASRPAELALGWTAVELPTGPRDTPTPAAQGQWLSLGDADGQWIISRSALAAMCAAWVLIVASLAWVMLRGVIGRWWLATTLAAVAVVLVPVWLLAPAQLTLLALCLAALLRLCAVVGTSRPTASRPRGRSSVFHGLPPAGPAAVIGLLCLGTPLAAQAPPGGSGAGGAVEADYQSRSEAAEPAPPPEIFSVLIPLDDEGQVAGAYAYAPTRLLELLAGGGEGAPRTLPPRILAADYTLRMRRGMAGSPDQVQELSLDLRLQVPQSEVELRLPFDQSQLQLQRGSVGGQELFVGGRWLSQSSDAVLYRASSPGSQRLQLQFEPQQVTFSDVQGSLRCAIPPIPNATLRIVADSSSNFELRSLGSGRKTIATVSTELLGPARSLDVQWSPASQRSSNGQVTAEVFADTWLHARGDQVGGLCQLRIDNARVLPRDLHVVAEPGWEAVGTAWGDGQVVANELSSLGGRRIYTVRGPDDWDQRSRRVLRVMMVPRDPQALSNMAIPFLSLREVSQQAVTRTLGWTSEERATWRPEGLDMWQEIAPPVGLEWGPLGWPGRPQLYRLAGSMANSLRKSLPPEPATIDEMTQVHLLHGELQLNYRGQFSTPQPLPLTLVIPRQARVDSLVLDGSPRSYRISERGGEAFVEILPGASPTSHRMVELAFSQPLSIGNRSAFPRVFARDYDATRSNYRVMAGVGLECQLSPHPDLTLATTNIPAHELLPALESLIGQVDLSQAYRESAHLPLEFTLQRRPQPPLIGSAMALQATPAGWKATVTGAWATGDQPLDFAFFELPASARDSVDPGQLPAQLTPLGASGRMTLRVLPSAPVDGRTRVEFSFLLPGSLSSQAIALPQVAVLAEQPVSPLLGLPQRIDQQLVQWTGVGRRMDDLPVAFADPRWGDDYQWFEIDAPRSQLTWKPFESAPRPADLLVSRVTLASLHQGHVAGYVDYWLAPRGQSHMSLQLPEGCELLGVESGSQPAICTRDQQQVNILLQPNYLPVNVRVLLRWQMDGEDPYRLPLPQVLNMASATGRIDLAVNRLPHVRVRGESQSESQIEQAFSSRWAQLILETLNASRSLPTAELLAWLQDWHPQRIGLADGAAVASTPLDELALAFGDDTLAASLGGSAEDFWRRMWAITHTLAETADATASAEVPAAPPPAVGPEITQNSPAQWVRLNSSPTSLVLVPVAQVTPWSSRWLAAGMLAAASLIGLLLASRLAGRYYRLISAQPWVYWLQLAALTWWLLPIAWPSGVLALTALGMLLAQWMDGRRRQRLLARV